MVDTLLSKKVMVFDDLFCGTGLPKFNIYYSEYVCLYLSIPSFAIGSVFNIFNIIVFTRKNMISPNNLIFAHLAFVDLATIVAYLPYKWHECIRLNMYSVKEHRTYEWEMVSLHTWNITGLFHTISLWLTLMLAIWRYIAIAYPLKERQWCGMRRTRNTIIAGYVISSLMSIPNFFGAEVGPFNVLLDSEGYLTSNQTIGISTTINKVQLKKPMDTVLYLYLILLNVIIIRIVPSVVLTIFSYKLFAALLRARKRREMLIASICKGNKSNSKKQSIDRTTKMLSIILGAFFLAEIPHSICSVLTIIYGMKFIIGCYSYLWEPFNSLMLILASVNFVVYYFMSKQFRKTFDELFHCKIFKAEKQIEILPEVYKPYELYL